MYQSHPKITVIMPVYNGEPYLDEAINSILIQTFTDFEFLIIDDGSTDRSLEIIQRYQDSRIKLIRNPINKGLVDSLNLGLSLAKGEYIARMDCDDISKADRLARQVNFLEKHPEIGIIGSYCQLFSDKNDHLSIYSVPTFDMDIRWRSLLNCPFAHPTVMMRHQILINNGLNYDEQFKVTEDYNLWSYLLKYTKGFNFNYPLLQYRVRDGITQTRRQQQLKEHDFIAHRTIQETLPHFPITLKQVTQMRSLLVTGDFFDETGTLRIVEIQESINFYLDMLYAFLNVYSDHPEKNHLKRQEMYKISRLLLRLSRRIGFELGLREIITPQLQRFNKLLWF